VNAIANRVTRPGVRAAFSARTVCSAAAVVLVLTLVSCSSSSDSSGVTRESAEQFLQAHKLLLPATDLTTQSPGPASSGVTVSGPLLDLEAARQAWGENDPAHNLTKKDARTLIENSCAYAFGPSSTVATALQNTALHWNHLLTVYNPGVLWCAYSVDDHGTLDVELGVGYETIKTTGGSSPRHLADAAFHETTARADSDSQVRPVRTLPPAAAAAAHTLLLAALGRAQWVARSESGTSGG
jgi:hypothetical protein